MREFFTSVPGIIAIVGLVLMVLFALRADRSTEVGRAARADTRTIMQVVISVVVLAAALYVILSDAYEADTQKWAYGIVGTVVGYWLPSAK